MKRIIMIILAASLVGSLVACSNGDNISSQSSTTSNVSSVSSNDTSSEVSMTGDLWTDFRPSSINAVFKVPTDLMEKK